jgi:integrase
MPQKVETTHIILPRELIVYLRADSDVWQCRLKVGNKWMARTTKERDLDKAIERAKRLLFEAQLRKEANIPVITKKFRDIAKLAYQQMEAEQANPKVKAPVSYEQYKKIIKEYLVPYYGNFLIDKVDVNSLDGYLEFLTKQMGRPPAYSSMRKHNVTLNRIFDKAVEKGFITPSSRPQLETKGRKSEKYETFDIAEINALLANFPPWIANTTNQEKREQRELLYDYVRVLIDTGARPGKELLDLRWKNIRYRVSWKDDPKQEIDDDGKVTLVNHDGYDAEGELIERVKLDATVSMTVSGKTNERIANGFDMTFKVLKEIIDRNYNDPKITLKTLTESNDEGYVFRTRSGAEPSSFNHLFDRYLDEHNLLLDRNTGKKRVFYSLRSAHATAVMNLDQVPIRDLSKQLGNSVEMIQKHYDRATGDAIVENVKAPRARRALFNTDKVSDIYKSKKTNNSKGK